jgi:hypothetical protein
MGGDRAAPGAVPEAPPPIPVPGMLLHREQISMFKVKKVLTDTAPFLLPDLLGFR